MKRRTVMACESEGDTISPSGVSEIRRSLDAPAIRASVMKRFVLPLVLVIGILGSVGYFGIYGYYRFVNSDSVVDRYHNGDIGIGDNPYGENIVTKFSNWTGISIAEAVNQLYVPLVALDKVVNGRSIHFMDTFRHRKKDRSPAFFSRDLHPHFTW